MVGACALLGLVLVFIVLIVVVVVIILAVVERVLALSLGSFVVLVIGALRHSSVLLFVVQILFVDVELARRRSHSLGALLLLLLLFGEHFF